MHHAVKNLNVYTSICCLSFAPDHHLLKMQCEGAMISDLDNPTTHAMIKYVSSVSTYIDDDEILQHAPRTPTS